EATWNLRTRLCSSSRDGMRAYKFWIWYRYCSANIYKSKHSEFSKAEAYSCAGEVDAQDGSGEAGPYPDGVGLQVLPRHHARVPRGRPQLHAPRPAGHPLLRCRPLPRIVGRLADIRRVRRISPQAIQMAEVESRMEGHAR